MSEQWTRSWSMAGVWLVRTGPSLSDQLSFKESDGDKAALIAAAPDLLSLAHTFLDYATDMESGHLVGKDGKSYAELGHEDTARIKSAIAKATGK